MLARAPEDVTVGSVVRLLEVGQALVKCFATTGGRLHDHRLLPVEIPPAQRRGSIFGKT